MLEDFSCLLLSICCSPFMPVCASEREFESKESISSKFMSVTFDGYTLYQYMCQNKENFMELVQVYKH